MHMPNKTGRFPLYSDTSKLETGSTLYQIQNGKPKLIAYAIKRLQKPQNLLYSRTRAMLFGHKYSFSHLLKKS